MICYLCFIFGVLILSYTLLCKKIFAISSSPVVTIEDTLASLWNSLSLMDTETSTLIIDQTKLSTPPNAIVGRLAMKKVCESLRD